MARPRIPIADRMAAHTSPEPNSGCWLWTGFINADGYGMIGLRHEVGGKCRTERAHRVAYELEVGPIPEGYVIDHLCRVRCCVNPDHLQPVTVHENLKRGVLKNGKPTTHCAKGHEYTEANAVYLAPSPGGYARRLCAPCMATLAS